MLGRPHDEADSVTRRDERGREGAGPGDARGGAGDEAISAGTRRPGAWLAELLRCRRAELGRTQQQVARACGLGVAQVSALESGRTAWPSAETILRLATGYAVRAELCRGASVVPPATLPNRS